ncbi:hypothetical protein [Priestia megaterium]|uniref:hypothetical protein n=1 Tax=Priestia megaterium TaxID=1404 RepID=UPI00207AA187|nr:hypothetical protein [Priestia megaterium]USL28001.1 hypothetical protein LIT33_30280 [Priestia megaterium]
MKIEPFYDDNVYSSQSHDIHLLFYGAEIINGEVIPVVHDDLKWTTIEELASFDFAPADIPIVKRLMKEDT